MKPVELMVDLMVDWMVAMVLLKAVWMDHKWVDSMEFL